MTRKKTRMLVRFLSGECGEKEKRKIEQWISSNPRNRETFNSFKEIWEISGGPKKEWRSTRTLTSLRLKLKDAEPPAGCGSSDRFTVVRLHPRAFPTKNFPLKSAVSVAAALVFMVVVVYLSTGMKKSALERADHRVPAAEVFEEVSTRPGEQATLSLSDGTRILLNSDSRLRYSQDTTGSREFDLIGEAYFEIPAEHRLPILVKTAAAEIRDIGTRFDVSAWPDDKTTRVAVAMGKVIVSPRQGGSNAMLASGQSMAVDSAGILSSPRYANIERIISWTDGKLVFYNDPLSDVIKQLQRRYGIRCFISEASIGSRRLTATFDRRISTREVLDIVALSLKLRYKTSKDSAVFMPIRSNSN